MPGTLEAAGGIREVSQASLRTVGSIRDTFTKSHFFIFSIFFLPPDRLELADPDSAPRPDSGQLVHPWTGVVERWTFGAR